MSDFFDKNGKQKSWLNIAHYGIRLSHTFEIPSISNEKPSISIKNLAF